MSRHGLPAAALEDLVAHARARFAARDLPGAVAALDDALASAPERADLWSMRGVARSRQGDHRGALEDHEEALRRDPDDLGGRVGRGMLRLRQRDYLRAAHDLQRALELLPPRSDRATRLRRALDRARGSLGGTVVRGFRVPRASGEGPVEG
ncbi:MAG: tetratricopeptide repeat protein [Planctomycetes bacterium]|nr:tetratricopeptide repeat protein [Planctomycetota bacterium]